VIKASVALLAVFSLAVPAFSQAGASEGECREAFKGADVIQDGILTHTEIPKAQQMPSELAKETLVSQREFMAACVKTAQAKQAEKPAPASPKNPGVSVSPETSGHQQPQGKTGPLETQSGGAPAESPQGQAPPGMQSAPDGSSKTITGPDPNQR
jgi:hypothetical protein